MADFEYVIVGAGSAGCVLAERLSANGRHRVLLIEEGPARENFLSRMPKGFGKLLTSPERAHFIPTNRVREGSNQPEVWVRGKMVGGSSSVNGMVWNRGCQADYDRLGELAGPQWSWEEMLPYLRGIEDHAFGASESTGAGGEIKVKDHPARTPLIEALLQAGRQAGLPVKRHHHEDAQEGIGTLQWNIDRSGRRVSAARGFVDKARGRSNLTIASDVRIDRVEIVDGRAVAVTGVRGGEPVRFAAAREVILAAGAIGSPRVLQLSGIGPAGVLRAAGVDVLIDQPDIGRHLREHFLLIQNFRLRDGRYSQNKAYAGLPLLRNMLRFMLLGSGPMGYGSSEAAAFVRVLEESGRPDCQVMFQPYSLQHENQMVFEQEPGLSLYAFPLRPRSEGSIAIRSHDPTAALSIDPNYQSEEHDRRVNIASVRFIRHLMAQPALAPFVVGETATTAAAQEDEEILAAYRRFGQAGYHSVGTVMMGRDRGPLDGRLRLRGVANLRVCDCSVFPEMIAGNTNAPTMAMAARAADLILEDAKVPA